MRNKILFTLTCLGVYCIGIQAQAKTLATYQAPLNTVVRLDHPIAIDDFYVSAPSGRDAIKNVTIIYEDDQTEQYEFNSDNDRHDRRGRGRWHRDHSREEGRSYRFKANGFKHAKFFILTGHITENGSSAIIKIPQARYRLQVGDRVLETKGVLNIRTVKAITPSRVQLFDGTWYEHTEVHKIIGSYDGFREGDDVREWVGVENIRKILNIAENGMFQLDDNNWYTRDQFERLIR